VVGENDGILVIVHVATEIPDEQMALCWLNLVEYHLEPPWCCCSTSCQLSDNGCMMMIALVVVQSACLCTGESGNEDCGSDFILIQTLFVSLS
jgi:hypothetical protein